jgi:hypothetical protein
MHGRPVAPALRSATASALSKGARTREALRGRVTSHAAHLVQESPEKGAMRKISDGPEKPRLNFLEF